MNKYFRAIVLFVSGVALSGCAMQWVPNWQEAGQSTPNAQAEDLAQQARLLFVQARDRDSLLASIKAHKQVLTANSGDYEILASLSTQYILLGTAYTEDRGEKSRLFRQAMRYAELAMYTNVEFKKIVAAGSLPWEATEALAKKEVAAMFFWVTALQYEFKEGMTLPGKIVNLDWMARGLRFLDRIETVDPDFGGGAVEFAKVICYYVLPKSKGGSETKGDEYMARSVAKGEEWLLPRWARGKYYYAVKGEDEKARQDLAWVASRNLEKFKDPAPWKVHFQENARALLD